MPLTYKGLYRNKFHTTRKVTLSSSIIRNQQISPFRGTRNRLVCILFNCVLPCHYDNLSVILRIILNNCFNTRVSTIIRTTFSLLIFSSQGDSDLSPRKLR